LVLGGDFNGRCGEQDDFIEGSDEVKSRDTIDYIENSHGDKLIDFLTTTSMVMLNGRVGTNGYTCVSHRVKSVVDYIIVPYEQVAFYTDFSVNPISDIITRCKLPVIANMLSKLDRPVLNCELGPWLRQLPCDVPNIEKPVEVTRYRLDQMPAEYMQNKWNTDVRECIDRTDGILT
jgi:hypothetical protein